MKIALRLKAFAACLFFGLSGLCNLAHAQPGSGIDPAHLKELIPEDVPAPNPGLMDQVDFAALRSTFGKRVDFQARCELSRPSKEWTEAMQAGNHAAAYDINARWFNKCPVDAIAHLWAIASAQKIDALDKAEAHKRWFIGLTDSVLKTGDGKSPQTAFVTISIAEEYAVLARFRLKRMKQSLLNGPPMVDMLLTEAIDNPGQQFTLYFNPYWHFVRLTNEFSDKKLP